MSEENKVVSASDDTKLAVPLRNLISILGAVAVSTWCYFGVIERLNKIESTLESHWEEIEENDDWIDDFQPPKAVQDTVERVRDLEIRINILETKLGND
tara:strand:+ start:315 stop:611 length:297 start_codon:yes stop_codon:yes gene_type:complete